MQFESVEMWVVRNASGFKYPQVSSSLSYWNLFKTSLTEPPRYLPTILITPRFRQPLHKRNQIKSILNLF